MIDPKIPMYIAVRLERGFGETERAVWLPLPATKKEFEAAQQEIGADYYDFEITCYNVRVPGLTRWMLMETPLSKVNHLASRLALLDKYKIAKLCAIIDSDRHFTTIDQYIDYTYNHDKYTLLYVVKDAADLGCRSLCGEDFATVPAYLKACIDPFKFGLKIAEQQGGQFTAMGYLTSDNGWSAAPRKRNVPAALNLTGIAGEDLYGEWVDDDDYFEYEMEEYEDE